MSVFQNPNLNVNYWNFKALGLFNTQEILLPGNSQCCGTSHFHGHLEKL